jgi:hypothetical protein
MARRAVPFDFTRRGYRCNLDTDERFLVRRLIGEVRELLTGNLPDDPKMRRLFPPAYLDEAESEAQSDYQKYMHDELVASRLDCIMRVETFLADEHNPQISADDLDAFASALNGVRLVLGTLLSIDDEDDDEDLPDDSGLHINEMNLYNYLSWLLESAIAARMKGWEQKSQ